MSSFLIFYTTYDAIKIAMFSDAQMVASVSVDKHHASAQLISATDSLLRAHNCSLENLALIAAVGGPAPFTSLRTVLTTINSVAYVTHIPTVALDGIQTLLAEYADARFPATVLLMNAFNKEMYYGFYDQHAVLQTGYAQYEHVVRVVRDFFPHQVVRYIGNGVPLWRQQLEHDNQELYIPSNIPLENSLPFLGTYVDALRRNGTQIVVQQLFPLYLKSIV